MSASTLLQSQRIAARPASKLKLSLTLAALMGTLSLSQGAVAIATNGAWNAFSWHETGFDGNQVSLPPGNTYFGNYVFQFDGASGVLLPFTFTIPGGFTGKMDITDIEQSGDLFQVFDFASNLGFTSSPTSGDTQSDPDVALLNANFSHATYTGLTPGNHSITINVTAGAGNLPHGGGRLRVTLVPEPASSLMALLGLGGVFLRRRRN